MTPELELAVDLLVRFALVALAGLALLTVYSVGICIYLTRHPEP